MRKINYYVILLTILTLISCKEKLTCDNENAVILMKNNIKSDMIDAWALKLAADDYQGSREGWLEDMNDTYEEYLLEKLKEIKMRKGIYYKAAYNEYIVKNILLENIVTEKLDENLDKCECSANIKLSNGSKNIIEYEVFRNSEGEITGRYLYRPKAMLDEKNNASDFIKNNEEKLE